MPTCSCSCSAPARRRRPTASLVLATAALVVALGGTSYAASVAANSVGNKQLKNNAVTSAKIASGSVTRSDIRAGNIYGVAMAPKAVTGAKIADNAVTGSKVADSSLGSADIANGAINNGDIAGGTIDNTRIADNTIGLNDIETSAKRSLINVPAEVVTNDFQNNPQTMPVDTTYNPVLSWSTHSEAVGTSILLTQVNVTSTDATALTCRIARQPAGTAEQDVELTSSTISLQDDQTSTLTLMTMVTLAASDTLQVQCKRSVDGFAQVNTGDTADSLDPTSMAVIRIAR